MKLKSFGLIEAMIASFVVITVFSVAVVLANSVKRSTNTEAAYFQAETISNNFLENLNLANSAGKVFFDEREDAVENDFAMSVDCFDSSIFESRCLPIFMESMFKQDYSPLFVDSRRAEKDGGDPPYYNIMRNEINQELFGERYFKIKTAVRHYKNAAGLDACPSASTLPISADKCRIIDIEIKWSEPSGDKKYNVSRFIGDWTR